MPLKRFYYETIFCEYHLHRDSVPFELSHGSVSITSRYASFFQQQALFLGRLFPRAIRGSTLTSRVVQRAFFFEQRVFSTSHPPSQAYSQPVRGCVPSVAVLDDEIKKIINNF